LESKWKASVINTHQTSATLLQNTPVTKAFVRDVGITDMHIDDMLWAISRQYLDILSSPVTLTLQN
jgi:hypothetical protein